MQKYILNIHLFGYLLIFISIIFAMLASYYQPFMGDDFIHAIDVLKYESLYNYLQYVYLNVNGRFFQGILEFFIYQFEYIKILLKILIIPAFILCTWLCWYLATGKLIKFKDNNFWKYIIFSIFIWLSLPAISLTLFMSAGSTTYFWPFFSCIIYMTLIKFFLFQEYQFNILIKIAISISTFFFGFIVSSSQEQIGLSTNVLLIYFIFKYCFKNNVTLNIYLVFSMLGCFLGFITMVFAPGNFIRIDNNTFNLFNNFITFIFYFISAFFKLAGEDKGAIFWMSSFILVYLINPNFSFNILKLKNSIPWLLASLACLVFMAPLTYHISLRTTFFSIFFFYIFLVNYSYNDNNIIIKTYIKQSIIIISSLILFFDSFSGLLANHSLHKESQNRILIINNAITNNQNNVLVPHYTTIPSRLTFIFNPIHDIKYTKYYSNNEINIKIDGNSPPPFSKNTLKDFKFIYLK